MFLGHGDHQCLIWQAKHRKLDLTRCLSRNHRQNCLDMSSLVTPDSWGWVQVLDWQAQRDRPSPDHLLRVLLPQRRHHLRLGRPRQSQRGYTSGLPSRLWRCQQRQVKSSYRNSRFFTLHFGHRFGLLFNKESISGPFSKGQLVLEAEKDLHVWIGAKKFAWNWEEAVCDPVKSEKKFASR